MSKKPRSNLLSVDFIALHPDSGRLDNTESEKLIFEIGRIAVAWNDLMLSAGWLFAAVHNLGRPTQRPARSSKFPGQREMAIWTSVRVDRDQLAMLAAAVHGAKQHLTTKQLADIGDLIKKATALADRRNDVLHTPFLPHSASGLKPVTMFGHSRAKKVLPKNQIDTQISQIREWSDLMFRYSDFARRVMLALGDESATWPRRPS